MKIAVVGAGHIGARLARAWTRAGHTVTVVARGDASISDAEVVVLAVPAAAVPEVVHAHGGLADRIVIDCTNAIGPGPALRWGHDSSAAEELARLAPAAHVFKAFNTQGAEILDGPSFDGEPAAGFFCGDDAARRSVVAALIADVGFAPVDCGPLASARLLEPLTLVWFAASRALGTREVAFGLLRR